MPYPVQIDEEHNKAIRAAIGEHLRVIHLLAGRQRVQRPIRQSLDRLDEVENETSPSSMPAEKGGWLSRLLPGPFR
jgi:hypothetical protein